MLDLVEECYSIDSRLFESEVTVNSQHSSNLLHLTIRPWDPSSETFSEEVTHLLA